MRKSKYLEQKKEVPVAMDEADIAFQILSRGKYATSLFDIFSLEQLAIILEVMQ